jgi:hypothetical protein
MSTIIGPSPSLFEVLANDTSHRREAARTALALAHTRVETHLGEWLRAAKTEQEFEQRLALVQSDFDHFVATAAEEVGHTQPQHIAAALKDHYRLGIEIEAMVKEAPGKQHMKGVSPKRNRQYEHIKENYLEEGMDEEEAKELAARTVNKQRRQKGETKKRKSSEGEQSAPLAKEAGFRCRLCGREMNPVDALVGGADKGAPVCQACAQRQHQEAVGYEQGRDPRARQDAALRWLENHPHESAKRADWGEMARSEGMHGYDGPMHWDESFNPEEHYHELIAQGYDHETARAMVEHAAQQNADQYYNEYAHEEPRGNPWSGHVPDDHGPMDSDSYDTEPGYRMMGATKEAAPVPDPFSAEDTYRQNPQFAHETCPNCGITLDEWGRCPRCGYQANDQHVEDRGPYTPWSMEDPRFMAASRLVTCPECGGDGKTANAGTCPKCGGRGRVADFGESVLDQLDGKASSVNWQVVPHPEMYAQDAPEAPGIEYPPGYGYSEQGGFHASVYRDIHEPESGPTEESAFAAGFNNHRCAECGHRYDEHGPNGECPGWQGTYHDPATYPPEGGFHASVKIADDNHGNTGLDGPEPKMDKSQGPGSKPDVPGKIVRKDPLRVIGPMRNDHPLQELGDIKQESLPSSENAGFSDGKVDSGPHTKTFGDGKHADPVTRETISSWPSDDSVSQAFATLAGFNMGIGQQMDPASLQRGLTQPPGQASPPPSTTPQQAQQPANQPSPSVGGGLGQLGQNAIPGLENPAQQGNEMLNMGQPPPGAPNQPPNLQNPFSFGM